MMMAVLAMAVAVVTSSQARSLLLMTVAVLAVAVAVTMLSLLRLATSNQTRITFSKPCLIQFKQGFFYAFFLLLFLLPEIIAN
jgi:uncharacterized membrane protein